MKIDDHEVDLAITKDIMKEAVREVISEWLDRQFSQFGRWTFYGLISVIIAAVAWWLLPIMAKAGHS
jgi:hypothetical protein